VYFRVLQFESHQHRTGFLQNAVVFEPQAVHPPCLMPQQGTLENVSGIFAVGDMFLI
jgi:hypothetical protein